MTHQMDTAIILEFRERKKNYINFGSALIRERVQLFSGPELHEICTGPDPRFSSPERRQLVHSKWKDKKRSIQTKRLKDEKLSSKKEW